MPSMLSDVSATIQSLSQESRPSTVYVCGLGGSGKTVFSQKLLDVNGTNGVVIQTDWYLVHSTEQRKKKIKEALDSGDPQHIENEENPRNWYDWNAFLNDLKALQSTSILVIEGAWNQETGQKDLTVTLNVQQSDLIICDGIYLLHPPVIEAADLCILLEVSRDIVRQRAEKRDSHRSSPEYLAYKEALIEKYDLPYFDEFSKNADLIVENTDINCPNVLKVRSDRI